jgi:hypothetical protein
MGAAASLFYSSNDSEKQTLLRRCTPSEEQYSEQVARWKTLADHLSLDLNKRSGHPIRTWLQGSYKFVTQVRPVRKDEEFDIDLGVYFQWPGEPAQGRHNADTIRNFVQDGLNTFEKEYGKDEDVEEVCSRKPRCCRIRYVNGFHIDVPVYHLDPDRDARTLATSNGWEQSDPKAIYVWFRDRFEQPTRDKVRRHIRYMKTWAALKFKEISSRPSSILIAVLVADAAMALGSTRIFAEDEALRDLTEQIVQRLSQDRKVLCPVNPAEDLNRLSDYQFALFLRLLKELQDVARRANSAEYESQAADIWQEAFEYMFPMPDPDDVLAKDSERLPAVQFMPEVKVAARSKTNRDARPFSGVNSIGPIPKNCDITFEVTNAADMPRGSAIHWTVRNEGREAELENDLGHVKGTGAIVEERSEYKGTHYMDCVVKVVSQTVAIRRIPVIVTGFSMPLRNPLRKLRSY